MPSKVLFILHYPPPIHGSSVVGKYIRDSNVLLDKFNCKFINLGTSRTVDEIGKNTITKWARYFYIIGNTISALITFKPDLVYFTLTAKGGGFYKDVLIVFIVKVFNKRVVYHFHNKGISKMQHKVVDNYLYSGAFKNASVILLSKFLYPDIRKYMQLQNVYICPNGIPDVQLNFLEKRKKEKINILFLSNLIETKGVFVLLEACALLRKKELDFSCTIIGAEGDLNEEKLIKKASELNLIGDISYEGKRFGMEKNKFLLNADIFVFPTFYENEVFPLVILEAMQFSLPVISTFEGGIPDVVDDGVTGFLVPQKDCINLANKIELLINNPKLRIEMGLAGRKRYEDQFTLSRFEARLANILEDIDIKSKRIS